MNAEQKIHKGRRALLWMQVFSTLGFGVLYSSLVLYATQGLKLGSHFAIALVGGFIAFNFSLHFLGGYIGGRLLSYRGLYVIGMVLQALGCAIISLTHLFTLLLGLAIFLAGCGLNVICLNCMMMQLFDAHDKRRESAFLWNYSGMNIGFFIGFTVSGFFQLHQNFSALFLFAACGSILSLVITLLNWKYLVDHNTAFIQSNNKGSRALIAIGMILGLIISLTWLLHHANIANKVIELGAALVALLFVYLAWKEPRRIDSHKLWAYLILTMSSLIFWTLYQMAPMGLTLFFIHNVRHELFGFTIPPQWTQNMNTIVIVLGGPIMAAFNQNLRKKGYKISIPFQFTTALFLISIGYFLLPIGIHYADQKGMSSIGWFIMTYVMQSIGELFISPIGYAMVGQLVPVKIQGLAMGAWLMVTGVAATFSSYFSQIAIGKSHDSNPLVTNPSFSSAFLKLAIGTLICSIILFFLRPFLHKLIQEKPSLKSVEPAPYNAPQD